MITVPLKNGTGCSIPIEVLGYEDPDAPATSYDWLRCNVGIVAGPFAGTLAATITTQDFESFHRELIKVLMDLDGTASFVTDEEWLQFTVTMGRRGNCTITGTSTVFGGPRATLSFEFDSDQSYLAETERGVSSVIEKFPSGKSV